MVSSMGTSSEEDEPAIGGSAGLWAPEDVSAEDTVAGGATSTGSFWGAERSADAKEALTGFPEVMLMDDGPKKVAARLSARPSSCVMMIGMVAR